MAILWLVGLVTSGSVGMRFSTLGAPILLLAITSCSSESSAGETVTEASIPLSSLSQFQQDVFADGTVTFEEYERSFIELVGCIADRGVLVEGPVLESDSTYSFITTESAGDPEGFVESAVTECSNEFTSAVELGYADALGVSESDDEAFYEDVATCVRSGGVDVADSRPASLSAAREADPELYDTCFRQVAGLPESSD